MIYAFRLGKHVGSLLIVSFTLPFYTQGQNNHSQIGFGTGWYYKSFYDQSISESSDTGYSMPLLLFFRSNTEKNRHHLQLLFTAPTLTSPNLLVRDQTGCLQYAYHRMTGYLKKNINLFVGGLIELNGSYLRYSEKGNSYSYSYPFTTLESNGSLSPSVLVEMPLKNDKITIQAWTAIVGYNFGGLKYERGWVWIGDFSNTGARISYSKYFSNSWEGRVDYQFQYFTLTKIESISSYVHQFNFSLVYKFRS
jgi:hypothetical protein